jgi:hypothetical protein
MVDAAAAPGVTVHIQVASAAAMAAATTKSKLPHLQSAECDTAAALSAEIMQQHTKQLHWLPRPATAAVVVATGGGRVGGKQSGWLRRVCSRLFACGAGSSLSRVDGF